jgi:hypothetical protein
VIYKVVHQLNAGGALLVCVEVGEWRMEMEDADCRQINGANQGLGASRPTKIPLILDN